ncbi:hypothetical protein KM043_009422 [Ampulex compressa]|nr:hypothetical protein KM043_009422 [Ampulex compressa]
MVVCKYYRQGNCRYGQYCQYEHVNRFENDKVEPYNEDEIIATVIAKEVVFAERGGQWLLSCFGPFENCPCIPGMEDLSPEEVRWEMYQAQKNGMVEQAKLRYQQLCQDMKTKQHALKNPTRETRTMLLNFKKMGRKGGINAGGNTGGKSSNFTFATPQLGLPTSTSSTNVFGNKTFGMQNNPFGGSFTPSSNNSVFGRNFGAITSQSNSVFGGAASQSVFGQPSAFGTSQTNNVFARPETTQATTSVFDSAAAPSTSLFNGPMTSQAGPSLFGGAKTTANAFGASPTLQTTNSVFGGTASSGNFNTGILGQAKTLPAFGGAPVFGGVTNFANNSGSIFGGQAAFGASSMPANNIFGGPNAATSGFVAQPANNFGSTVSTSTPNVFGGAQTTGPAPNVTPFGVTTTTTSSSPFVTASSQFSGTNTTATPFSRPAFGLPAGGTSEAFGTTVTASGTPFGTTVTSSSAPFGTTVSSPSAPFGTTVTSASTPFGTTVISPSAPFGTTVTSPSAPFGTTVTSSSTPFGQVNTGLNFGTATAVSSPFTNSSFGDNKSSPFASTNTTMTTTNSNPFAPRTHQSNSPFGNTALDQANTTLTGSSDGPFGKSPFGTTLTTAIIDDSVYTTEGQLTDDEKAIYLAERFVLGKIPLKPPTKDIR